MQDKNSVIFLGLFQTSINAARIFHKRKIPVIGYDYDETQLGFHSRLIEPYRCPDPLTHPEQLVQYLEDKISHLKLKPVILPASDEFVYFLNFYREKFSKISCFLLPETNHIEIFLDKKRQFIAAGKAGLNVPKYFEPSSIEEIEASADRLKYPVFIKARRSFLWRKHFVDKGFLVENSTDLAEKAKLLFEMQIDFLVQEIVQGSANNNIEVNLLRLNPGTIYFHTIRKMRQYPIDFGTATSVHTDHMQTLEDATIRFVNQTDLTGFSNTEFKYDPQKQKYFFVETNPRIWLQIDLCEYLNDNLLIKAYNFLTGNSLKIKPVKPKKVYWIDFPNDLFSLMKQINSRPRDYFTWMKNALAAKSHGTFYWRDSTPFFRYTFSSLSRKFLRPFKKSGA